MRDRFWDLYYASIPLISLNLYWLIFSLLLITIPPALAALYYSTNQLVHGDATTFRDFFDAFRRYFLVSWGWFLLNVVAYFVGINSIFFYSQIDSIWVASIQTIVICTLVVWTLVSFFTLPMLVEQKKPNLFLAMRNSLILFLRRPLPTLGLVIMILAVDFASIYFLLPIWIFIMASLTTYTISRYTIKSIIKINESVEAEQKKKK